MRREYVISEELHLLQNHWVSGGRRNSVISRRSHLWYEERNCVVDGGMHLQYDQKVV